MLSILRNQDVSYNQLMLKDETRKPCQNESNQMYLARFTQRKPTKFAFELMQGKIGRINWLLLPNAFLFFNISWPGVFSTKTWKDNYGQAKHTNKKETAVQRELETRSDFKICILCMQQVKLSINFSFHAVQMAFLVVRLQISIFRKTTRKWPLLLKFPLKNPWT